MSDAKRIFIVINLTILNEHFNARVRKAIALWLTSILNRGFDCFTRETMICFGQNGSDTWPTWVFEQTETNRRDVSSADNTCLS